MSRPLRIVFQDASRHMMNRGKWGEKEIPESKALTSEVETIMEAVCKAYGVGGFRQKE